MGRPHALLLGAMLSIAGCGPWGPQGIFAGGPLLGSTEPAPSDWSFTDAHPLIAIETRGRFFVSAQRTPSCRAPWCC